VRACHDLSEGGLAVAAAEMAFSGDIGLQIDLDSVPYHGPDDLRRDSVLLFSESASRFLAEVRPEHAAEFEGRLAGVPLATVGRTEHSRVLTVNGLHGTVILNASLGRLKAAWKTPLI